MISRHEFEQAHYLHAQHYLTRLQSYAELDRIESHMQSAVRQFENDWYQIEHSFKWSAHTEHKDGAELCAAFCEKTAPFLTRQQGYALRIEWHTIAMQAAQHLGQPDRAAHHMVQLGSLYRSLADYETARAYIQQALALAHETKAPHAIIIGYEELGIIAKQLGQQKEAWDYTQQALDVARALEEDAEIAQCLCALSTVAYEMGDLDNAITLGRECHTIYERIGPPQKTAYSAYVLGSILLSTDAQLEDARRLLWRSYDLHKQMGDKRFVASTACSLASDLIDNLREYEQAIHLAEEALETYCTLNIPIRICCAITILGDAAFRQGNLQQARERYTEALALAQEITSAWNIITLLLSLGRVANQAEQYDEAQQHLTAALTAAVETQTASLGRIVLVQLALTLACRTGQFERAIELIGCAIADAAGDKLVDHEAEPILARLRQELPPSTFAQTFERGKLLDFDRVVEDYM